MTTMTNTLMINEIFYSIQGESTWAGLPCLFIRLTGCHLRCRYCDTAYAFHEGRRQTLDDIITQTHRLAPDCPLVEVTGGEPLLQPAIHPLMSRLCDTGKTVLLETSGACDITPCDPRVIRIMDLKTPASGESNRNLFANIDHLTPRDEIKFVLCSRDDYTWARSIIDQYNLASRVRAILLSAVAEIPPNADIAGSPSLSLRDLAQWVLQDHLPVRLQTQLHKLIWDPTTRGV
jgi:7-carboxy-7-deazaguanine synthase